MVDDIIDLQNIIENAQDKTTVDRTITSLTSLITNAGWGNIKVINNSRNVSMRTNSQNKN